MQNNIRMPMSTGDEYDALSKGGKKYHLFRAGKRKRIKRLYKKKERRWLDHLLIEEETKDAS